MLIKNSDSVKFSVISDTLMQIEALTCNNEWVDCNSVVFVFFVGVGTSQPQSSK